jgi:hypothetical protein
MSELVKYNAACQALAVAKAADEVKDIRDKAEAMRAYAHQAKNRQMEIDAAEIRIRAERRLGELIKQQKETVGLNTGAMGIGKSVVPTGNRTPTLADVGIDKKLSSHAQKVAAIPEDEFEEIVDDWRGALQEANERVTTNILAAADKMQNKPHVSNNSGNNEWYTPPEFIEAARKVMGSIETDPASNDIAQQTVKAATYYTAENSGLDAQWHGNVWMNPPYSSDLIGSFCEKLISEHKAGQVTQAIVLVNNATEARWFRTLISSANMVGFTNKRVRFIDKEGNPSGAPLQGQAIIYIGDNKDAFIENFSEHCWIAEIAAHG